MATKPNTPQITTAVPRRFKQAWEIECLRLKHDAGIESQGDVQKYLVALLLAEKDHAKRNEMALKGQAEFLGNWNDEESVNPNLGLQSAFPAGYSKASDKPLDTDSKGPDRTSGRLGLPKRGK